MTAFVQQNIARFDVSVYDALRMRTVERVTDLRYHSFDLLKWQRAALKRHGKGAGLDERHDNVCEAICLAEVMNRENVRMLQVGQYLGFLLEPPEKFRILRQMAREDLQRDVSVN